LNIRTFLIDTLFTALVVLVIAYILPGIHLDGFGSAILVALALALLNALVKPILVIFTIPATILTLGLFLLVINALVILLADWMVLGFFVEGFWWALLFSILLSLIKSIFYPLVGQSDKHDRD
jgi:putative membrane protein